MTCIYELGKGSKIKGLLTVKDMRRFAAVFIGIQQVCCLYAATAKNPTDCASRPCTYRITCAQETCSATEAAEVQIAIDDARPGDTIELEAGRIFPSPMWWLRAKDGSPGYITITTTRAADLPDENTRITPAYASLLPRIVAVNAPFPAIQTDDGELPRPAERYKLVGLMFTNRPGMVFTRGLVVIGNTSGAKRTFRADAATDVITTVNVNGTTPVAHGMPVGQSIQVFTDGTLPSGLQPNKRYYVVTVTSNTVKVSETPGGKPVDITDQGSGTHTLVDAALRPQDQARDIIIDRCYFTATLFDNLRRAIGLHGTNSVVRNSFIERAKDNATDAQAILSYNGTGPYTIENNFLEGTAENVMFGGAIGSVISNPPLDPNGVTPADILVRWNYMSKNAARYKLQRWSPGLYVEAGKAIQAANGPETFLAVNSGYTSGAEPVWPETVGAEVVDGEVTWRAWSPRGRTFHWIVKNHFELKAAERAVIQHNVFENLWRDGQETSISFKTANQVRPGGEYLARTENILFRDNIVRSVPAAWKGAEGEGGVASNWHVINNLFLDVDNKAYGAGNERQLQILSLPFPGIILDHNTIISPNSAAAMVLERAQGVTGGDAPVIFRNNIMQRGTQGVKGSGTPEGIRSLELFFCAGAPCPESDVGQNIIAGVNRQLYANNTYNLCPTDAACAADYSGARFTDPANHDYSLADDSPYKGRATDGTDIGVDMSRLPQIRNLRVQATSRQAVFSYELSQPIQHIPCVLEVSRKRDLSEPVVDVNPVLFRRSDSDRRSSAITNGGRHIFVVGQDITETALDGTGYSRALSPLTQYYYRLQCGGDSRSGDFKTTDAPSAATTKLNVSIPAPPSGAQVKVDIGAAEDGAPGRFSSSTDIPNCASGCETTIDVRNDRVVYYRIRFSTSGSADIVLPVQAVPVY